MNNQTNNSQLQVKGIKPAADNKPYDGAPEPQPYHPFFFAYSLAGMAHAMIALNVAPTPDFTPTLR